MIKIWNKPTIVFSKCLGDSKCRYDGSNSMDKTITRIKDFVNVIEICPEEAIGLSTPRDPVRLVSKDGTINLLQLKSEKDVTSLMYEFSTEFINNLTDVDGFILKSKSPSCGTKEIKIYSSLEKGSPISSKGRGLFAEKVLSRFPDLAIEDEGRLKNFSIREHFLTKIFLISSFKEIKKDMSINLLIDFHSRNKLLLMCYSQKGLKELGYLVANHDNKDINVIYHEYESKLLKITSKASRYTSNINVLYHALGYFTEKITCRERTFILDEIEKYRIEKCPLSVPLTLLKSYAIRFNIEYLLNQTFLMPYPEELIDICDSGKGTVR